VPEHVYQAAVRLVRKTRPGQADTSAWINDSVAWGAGPRAVQYLVLGAKSRAALRGSYMASLEDLEAVAPAVLNHRVITNFNAESQGMNSKKIVERLIREARE
jgi:MoxR-like ATPase